MRYSILLEPIRQPGFEGWYYAHIPVLDLTTQGQGIEGAMAAAEELARVWVEEKQKQGAAIPRESGSFISSVEIPDAALGS